MKTFGIALAAAAALLVSAPAMAEDRSGPRVGVTTGIVGDKVATSDTAIFGVEAGYDFDLGNVVVGATAGYEDTFDGGEDNLVTVGARLGVPVGRTLVYGSAAWANASGEDGYRVGGGVEVNLTKNLTAKVEQRYLDFGRGADGFSTVVGLGVRF